MFIYNFKLNSSIAFKILLGIIVLVVICMCIIVCLKIFNESKKSTSCIQPSKALEPTNENYSSLLQAVHNNIDTYVGQKIKFSGFVYRVYDLNQEQFILGRNMIISSDFQTVVVGFLAHYKDSIKLRDNMWIEVEGTVTKGQYHGADMPILEITSIKEIEKPNDEYVYPPDENYIPTSNFIDNI